MVSSAEHGPLVLSPSGLAAAVLLLPGPLDDDRVGEAVSREIAELRASGLIHRGALAPWVARRLTLLLTPDLHAEAIAVNQAGTSITQIWARVDTAMLGQIDPRGWVHISPVDPRSLAWTMGTLVGLGDDPSDHPVAERPAASGVTIDPDRLQRFHEALAIGDHRKAHDMLTDGEQHSGQELAVMAALASPERRTWRIATRWTSATGPEQRWLSALDAGPAGLWCSSGASLEGVADRAAPLRATSTAEIWDHLIATLPPGTSDAPRPSPVNGPAPLGRAPCPPSSPPNPTASSASSQPPLTSMPA